MCFGSSQRPLHVLLVDDNDDFRRLTTTQLERLGCTVHAVSTSSDFLAALMSGAKQIDLSIVDIRLPGMNGDQLVSWLRNSETASIRNMPVLFVTGHADEVHYLARSQACTSVLLKPYSFETLRNAITALVSDTEDL